MFMYRVPARIVVFCGLLVGCGASSPAGNTVSGAPDGAFRIRSAFAFYDQSTPYAEVTLTTDPNGCADEVDADGGTTPPGTHTFDIFIINSNADAATADQPVLGAYSLSADPPLTVFIALDSSGNSDEWFNTGGTVEVTKNDKDGLRGTFDIPVKEQVNEGLTDPTVELTGSFDATYCGPPFAP